MDDPTARVLQLLSLLQTHRYWPGGELAERLDVSARTLRRDVDRLRRLGYPVDATTGAAGGYRLGAGAHMPPLLLDDEEAVAIAVGLRAAAGASVEGIEETSLRALAKLEQVLPDRLRRRVNAVHANVVPLRWSSHAGPTVDADVLAVLAQACRDHEQVRFEYQRRDGEETRRLVEPHQLVSAGRRWYLVAWDVRRLDWRSFRLDRLHAPALAGARFSPRRLPATDAGAFVAQSIRSMPMAHEATIVAHGPLEEVRSMVRWADTELESIDERSCRVRLRAESIEWLVSTITMLAVTVDVAVDDPPDLVARVDALAERLGRATSSGAPRPPQADQPGRTRPAS
ncbi:MAG: YafY family transcriptional regulator [Actinomycetota bacterium]|nr:YafY family transcriptional regulator [Actinomycetota bacterium]